MNGQSSPVFWSKFYHGDWMRETMGLSAEARGILIQLRIAYWEQIPLKFDVGILSRFANVTEDYSDAVLEVVNRFFSIKNGLLVDENLDIQIIAAHKRIETLRTNGRKGGRPKKAKPSQDNLPLQKDNPRDNPKDKQDDNQEDKLNQPKKKQNHSNTYNKRDSNIALPIVPDFMVPNSMIPKHFLPNSSNSARSSIPEESRRKLKPNLAATPDLPKKENSEIGKPPGIEKALETGPPPEDFLLENPPPEKTSSKKRSTQVMSKAMSDFDVWWKNYPRKADKNKAKRIWRRKYSKMPDVAKHIALVADWMKTKQWQDTQYIPYPSTWLENERWKDPVPESERSLRKPLTDRYTGERITPLKVTNE